MKTEYVYWDFPNGEFWVCQVPVMPDFTTVEGFEHSGKGLRGVSIDQDIYLDKLRMSVYESVIYAIYLRKISEKKLDILLVPNKISLQDIIIEKVKKCSLERMRAFEKDLEQKNLELVGAYIYPFIASEIPLLPYRNRVAGLIGKL